MKKYSFSAFLVFFLSLFVYFHIMVDLASADPNVVYVGSNPTMSDIRCNTDAIEIVDASKSLVSVEMVGILTEETSNRYAKQLGLKVKPYASVNTMVINFKSLTFTFSSLIVVDKNFNCLYSYNQGLNGKWEEVGKSGYVYATVCEVFKVIS